MIQKIVYSTSNLCSIWDGNLLWDDDKKTFKKNTRFDADVSTTTQKMMMADDRTGAEVSAVVLLFQSRMVMLQTWEWCTHLHT